MGNKLTQARRLAKILAELEKESHRTATTLAHENPWELLVATILSAQCTDKRVNEVTPALFSRYPTPAGMAVAKLEDIESLIRSLGLFRVKARSLLGSARKISEDHEGRVPGNREALEALPGVGRKTASVVLGAGFGIPAFPVDTHVARVCLRLGFCKERSPLAIEAAMCGLMDESIWLRTHFILINHGRSTCFSRNPACGVCIIERYCRWTGKS